MDPNPKVYLNDGNALPLIGLGMLNFKANDKNFNLNDFVMKAAKTGYTHFDVTNNQQAIGDALALVFQVKQQLEDEYGTKIPDQFQIAFPREKFFITYKVYNSFEIQENIKNALKTMKLQYFDLVMLNCPHSPPPPSLPQSNEENKEDNQEKQIPKKKPMKKAWQILENCQEKGLTKSIGVSNFTIQILLSLVPFCRVCPAVNQIQSHPYNIQKNMIELCKKLKILVIAYCPLLRGGKDQKQPLGDKIDYMGEPLFKELSVKYSKTIPQILLNYQICRGISVIPKTQKVDHMNDNFTITDFELLEQDIQEIEKLDRHGRVKVYQLKNTPIWRGEDPLC